MKTLKDYKGPNNLPIIPNLVIAKLQEDAREWIEYLQDFSNTSDYKSDDCVQWIKHFFNLEEE